jgi:hypothetical protein
MEIDSQALTTCEVAPNGDAISLGIVDTVGNHPTLSRSGGRAFNDAAAVDR